MITFLNSILSQRLTESGINDDTVTKQSFLAELFNRFCPMPAIRKMKALIKGEEFDQNISDEQTLVNNSSWFSACAVRTHS